MQGSHTSSQFVNLLFCSIHLLFLPVSAQVTFVQPSRNEIVAAPFIVQVHDKITDERIEDNGRRQDDRRDGKLQTRGSGGM